MVAPGPLEPGSFADAAGLALVRARAGDHTLRRHVVGGATDGTVHQWFATRNAVLVPFGTIAHPS